MTVAMRVLVKMLICFNENIKMIVFFKFAIFCEGLLEMKRRNEVHIFSWQIPLQTDTRQMSHNISEFFSV